MIQAGTPNTPTEAIPAAISTKTSLLLGLEASTGQENINNEITALKSAIGTYSSAFTDLIAGISVGSEDLYRISPTCIIDKSGAGAEPTDIVNYINQVKAAISGTAASGKLKGHFDTWAARVNGSNDAVTERFLALQLILRPGNEQSRNEAEISNVYLFLQFLLFKL